MNNSNVTIICALVLAIFASVSGSVYYGHIQITELKLQYENLTSEYNGLINETNMMNSRKQEFDAAFRELAKFKVDIGTSGANVDFYSEAQQAIRRGGAKVQSNKPNPSRDGRISMQMAFTGDYYSIIKAFAELRGLPNVVRVVSVSLASTNPDTSVNSDIKAEVLIEALASARR